jgi:hypothetical protein
MLDPDRNGGIELDEFKKFVMAGLIPGRPGTVSNVTNIVRHANTVSEGVSDPFV